MGPASEGTITPNSLIVQDAVSVNQVLACSKSELPVFKGPVTQHKHEARPWEHAPHRQHLHLLTRT